MPRRPAGASATRLGERRHIQAAREFHLSVSSVHQLFKGFNMQVRKVMAVLLLFSASIGFIDTAHAQGKTRDQVRQELIKAQQNGSLYVTDSSYPDASPIDQYQVDPQKAMHANDSGIGRDTNGAVEAGPPAMHDTPTMPNGPAHDDTCVGPISFCSIYFGS
jgi:Domain of unknown function (DUF4148)